MRPARWWDGAINPTHATGWLGAVAGPREQTHIFILIRRRVHCHLGLGEGRATESMGWQWAQDKKPLGNIDNSLKPPLPGRLAQGTWWEGLGGHRVPITL